MASFVRVQRIRVRILTLARQMPDVNVAFEELIFSSLSEISEFGNGFFNRAYFGVEY